MMQAIAPSVGIVPQTHHVDQTELHIVVAVVDDCPGDFFMIHHLLQRSGIQFDRIDYYACVDDLLKGSLATPDVVILDRCMQDSRLTESRIAQIRARHKNCGVILHTGVMTPSIRSAAAHYGAVAVIEKGSLNAHSMGAMVLAAAQVGPSIVVP